MMKAVEDGRLAVKQRLEESYKAQFNEITRLMDEWSEKILREMARAESLRDSWEVLQILTTPNENIKSKIRGKSGYEYIPATVCDSLILYDNEGKLIYPIPAAPPDSEENAQELEMAWELEYEQGKFEEAAGYYLKRAQQSEDAEISARAYLSAARCLLKGGRKDEALKILTQTLMEKKYLLFRDEAGSLIQPSALLLALQTMDRNHPEYKSTKIRLENMLPNQKEPLIPTRQRIFIMRELKEMDIPQRSDEMFRDALALEYVEKNPAKAEPGVFNQVPYGNVWQMASPKSRVIALFDESRTIKRILDYAYSYSSLSQVGFMPPPKEREIDKEGDVIPLDISDSMKSLLIPPGKNPPDPEFLALIPAGKFLPGFRLAFYPNDRDIFLFAAAHQKLLYLWRGILLILLVFVITFFLVRYMENQMRLAQLRNNLIATVSHELKTPLSSMRVLVDTLLEGRYQDQNQTREYLELISKENLRLSRLIDNFLTFSRMERNKKAFDFQDAEPGEIIREAVEAMREKFGSTGAEIHLEIADDLPRILADRDAMITALVNLLDNACKYTEDHKRIIIRAFKEGGTVCFQVEDNGIGIPARALRRIFDRFYQADQTLARKAGGCGLGLSIVKFIVEAHGGTIEVKSEPNKGSLFTIRLPIDLNRESLTGKKE